MTPLEKLKSEVFKDSPKWPHDFLESVINRAYVLRTEEERAKNASYRQVYEDGYKKGREEVLNEIQTSMGTRQEKSRVWAKEVRKLPDVYNQQDYPYESGFFTGFNEAWSCLPKKEDVTNMASSPIEAARPTDTTIEQSLEKTDEQIGRAINKLADTEHE